MGALKAADTARVTLSTATPITLPDIDSTPTLPQLVNQKVSNKADRDRDEKETPASPTSRKRRSQVAAKNDDAWALALLPLKGSFSGDNIGTPRPVYSCSLCVDMIR
jgi:cell division septation protein DedD